MEKTMTLNLRVNPTVKQQAEDVLKQLGIPMATAIDMYLRQITLTGGIPFSLSLPKAPAALNADTMTDDHSIQPCRWASRKFRTAIPWTLQAHSHSSGNSTDEAV